MKDGRSRVDEDPQKTSPQIGRYVVRLLVTSAFILCGGFLAFNYLPKPSPPLQSWQAKVMYTLRWQVFSFFTLVVGISFIALTRLFTPALNPLNPRGEQYVGTYVRCLQNTLEQLVISVPGQLILAGYVESDTLRIIPVLVFLFVAGRLAFWLGYPLQRTYGFMMTFLPTTIVYLANIFFFFQAGPSFRLTET